MKGKVLQLMAFFCYLTITVNDSLPTSSINASSCHLLQELRQAKSRTLACSNDRFIYFIYPFKLNHEQVGQIRTHSQYRLLNSVEERKCTDVCCLIIFLAITIGLLGLGIYAWTNGNFAKLRTAYDPDGKGCGVDYPQYPYIYFASPNVDVRIMISVVIVGYCLRFEVPSCRRYLSRVSGELCGYDL